MICDKLHVTIFRSTLTEIATSFTIVPGSSAQCRKYGYFWGGFLF